MKEELLFQTHGTLRHTRAYFGGGAPEAAAPRNITTEYIQTLRGHQQTAQPQFELEDRWQPEYNRLGLRIQDQTLRGYTDENGQHHPGTLEMGRASSRFQRAGDIADVAELGPDAYAAWTRSNPLLELSLGELTGRLPDSEILRTMNQQASAELAAGGALTPAEARQASQDARATYADLGLLHGDQAAGAELLNRDVMRRARLNERRQFAGTVQGMNQSQNDFAGRVGQIAGSQFDPFLATMNRSASSSGASGGMPQIGTGSRIFDPNNPYAQDVYNSNFNAENARNIAEANQESARNNAYLSAAASLAAAGLIAFSDERLKKDVKETGEKTADGIPVIIGQFKTDPKKRRWKMVRAGDVEKQRPDLVHTDEMSGIKMVDYWGLGMEPIEVAA